MSALVYSFCGGWMLCAKCGRTLAMVAPDKPKRHKCDPSLPDQEWRIRLPESEASA